MKKVPVLQISVVTAVFNREATIAEAIGSVAAQDYGMVEHVIQDGGSTDGTLDVIRRIAGPDVSLQTVRDGGIYDGVNRGIVRTSGDVVGLMHSDDLFAADDILSSVVAAFEDPTLTAFTAILIMSPPMTRPGSSASGALAPTAPRSCEWAGCHPTRRSI